MKIKTDKYGCTLIREPGDKRISHESTVMHHMRRLLNERDGGGWTRFYPAPALHESVSRSRIWPDRPGRDDVRGLRRRWQQIPGRYRGGKEHRNMESRQNMMTTQRQVRAAFWAAWRRGEFQPLRVTPRKITNYSGTGKMHNTDTRCTFVDWLDGLSKNGEVSAELADRVTL